MRSILVGTMGSVAGVIGDWRWMKTSNGAWALVEDYSKSFNRIDEWKSSLQLPSQTDDLLYYRSATDHDLSNIMALNLELPCHAV